MKEDRIVRLVSPNKFPFSDAVDHVAGVKDGKFVRIDPNFFSNSKPKVVNHNVVINSSGTIFKPGIDNSQNGVIHFLSVKTSISVGIDVKLQIIIFDIIENNSQTYIINLGQSLRLTIEFNTLINDCFFYGDFIVENNKKLIIHVTNINGMFFIEGKIFEDA